MTGTEGNAREGGTGGGGGSLVLVQPHPDGPELLLLRGRGLGAVLAQFAWAIFDAEGMVIPAEKLGRARDALQAASFTVKVAKELASTVQTRRMPLPLPECSACHAPYRRSFIAGPDDTCTECGAPLVLEQHDPNEEAHGPLRRCPWCDREVGLSWKFCTCGTPLAPPERETVDQRPWRERFTAEANAATVAAGGIDVRSPSPGATPREVEAQRNYWARFDDARAAAQRAPEGGVWLDELTQAGTAFGLPADVAGIDVEHWGQEKPPPEFRWPPEFDLPDDSESTDG